MKKLKYILSFLALTFVLSGCGNTEELENYYTDISNFKANVEIITETMDMIDVDSDNAPSAVVTQLEKLEEQFRILSELKAPKNFSGCDDLAADAYNYMQEAVMLYKEWADDPKYADEQLVDMSKQNYDRAMKRVNYISVILQGKTPEGEGVTTTQEDITDFNPILDKNSEEAIDDIDESIENTEEAEY